ncbi:MAG: c-type cytochrome biogenesis protein CcmI [Gammaproteobacteria bacterium]|jgi:cytochrome c-type biogenesis protein CcmH
MIVAIIVVLAIAFALIWILTKYQGRNDLDRKQQNIDMLRQEFVDLKAQLEAGELTQEEYQNAYDDLVVSLGDDLKQNTDETTPRHQFSQTWTLLGIFAVLAVLTPVLYYQIGTPIALHPKKEAAMETAHAAAGVRNSPSIAAMVNRLRQKLQQNPNSAEGWTMLGRSYMVLHNYDLAAKALGKAYALRSDEPNILLMYADALAMQNGGKVNAKAFKLIKRVLDHDPNDPTAMWMAAMAYESRSDYKTALSYWKRLLPVVKNNPKDYREVRMHLAHAQARLTGKPMALPSASDQNKQASANQGASVTAVIKLDAKYKSRVKPTETVFVYARAVNGPPQPLAAKRLQVKDLPAKVTLNDAMAMSPMNKLSDYAQVYIGARVSQSGNVMPSRGDLQGRSSSVATKDHKTIEVTIDKEVM